jgi:hypothetical protein
VIRRCCCNPTPCEGNDCTAAVADCATNGLAPFKLKIGARLDFTSCDAWYTEWVRCTNENCGTWGSTPCGGCSPCDPTGSAPGAAGRTCPCLDANCEHPQYQDWPYEVCYDNDSPLKNREGCRLWHPSFFYFNQTETQIDACDIFNPFPCDWLGSGTCFFSLVEVPAQFVYISCESVEAFRSDIVIDRIYNCPGDPPVFPPPFTMLPKTSASGLYGFPNGAPCLPGDPPPCLPTPGCYCSCNAGYWPFEVIEETIDASEICNPQQEATDGIQFRILSAVPCADDVGAALECGGSCECAESVIQIELLGYTLNGPRYMVGEPGGGPIGLDPTDPSSVEAFCQSIYGDPAITPPDSDCTGISVPVQCGDQCCQCQRSIVLAFKKKKSATLNLCQMEPGVYELAGITVCDQDGTGIYGCAETPGTDAPCIPPWARCNEGYLRNIAELMGWTNLYLEVWY